MITVTEQEEKQITNEPQDEQLKIPEVLPVLPLRDIVIFPFMIVPLFVSRDRSIRAVDQARTLHRSQFIAREARTQQRGAAKPETKVARASRRGSG